LVKKLTDFDNTNLSTDE